MHGLIVQLGVRQVVDGVDERAADLAQRIEGRRELAV